MRTYHASLCSISIVFDDSRRFVVVNWGVFIRYIVRRSSRRTTNRAAIYLVNAAGILLSVISNTHRNVM